MIAISPLVFSFLLAAASGPKGGSAMTLESPAFVSGGAVPSTYTCDGADVSPPLAWSGAPEGTKSLALIVTDPDAPDPKAPRVTWTHWVLYGIPASVSGLREAVTSKGLPPGTLEGKNDWGKAGYGGPCPPIGRHRSFFTLVALDAALPDLHHPTRAVLETAMEGHVLARAELMGTYEKKK